MGITHLSGLEVAGLTTMGIGGGLPIAPRYFWVNSATGSDGNTGAFDSPLATIGQAITKVGTQHKKGDTIVLMPGHSETITGAGGITCSTADVNIIGLGIGTDRPTFLMDGGTTVTFVISAANVLVRNCFFKSGHASVVACFDITAGGCWLDQLEFGNNTTNENFVTPIKATSTTDNNADGLTVTNCRWFTTDTDDREFIEINANLNKLTVKDNYVRTTSATAQLILSAGTKVLTEVEITGNTLINAMTSGSLFISNGASTNTGVIANNYCGNLDTTGAQDLGACANIYFFENYSTSVVTLSGGINPAADTPTT